MGQLFLIKSYFFRDEFENMLEIAWFGNTVVVTTVGESAPDFAVRVADSIKLGHIRRTVQVSIDFYRYTDIDTYGTNSSFKPLRNSIGTSVTLGRTSSLVQCW